MQKETMFNLYDLYNSAEEIYQEFEEDFDNENEEEIAAALQEFLFKMQNYFLPFYHEQEKGEYDNYDE